LSSQSAQKKNPAKISCGVSAKKLPVQHTKTPKLSDQISVVDFANRTSNYSGHFVKLAFANGFIVAPGPGAPLARVRSFGKKSANKPVFGRHMNIAIRFHVSLLFNELCLNAT
jgi:hypothetical protein